MVMLRLVPKLFSGMVLFITWMCLLSPFVTMYSLTPSVLDFVFEATIFVPVFSLVMTFTHDLALCFKGIPPSHRRPVQAGALFAMMWVIDPVIRGSIVDLLYLAGLPAILFSGCGQAAR